jgi:hypothetical protein
MHGEELGVGCPGFVVQAKHPRHLTPDAILPNSATLASRQLRTQHSALRTKIYRFFPPPNFLTEAKCTVK